MSSRPTVISSLLSSVSTRVPDPRITFSTHAPSMLLFTHSTTPCDKHNPFFVLPGMRCLPRGYFRPLGLHESRVPETSTLRPLVPSSVQPPAVFVCRLHALPGSSRGRSNIIQPRGPQCVASNQSLRKYSRGRNALYNTRKPSPWLLSTRSMPDPDVPGFPLGP